jgi:hypothetical protein
MSDNNTLHYGKGIPVTSGFDLGAKSPLDSRTVVDNFEELQLHVDGNRAYEGMLVYVNSEKKLYVYNGTDWEELTTNVDADNPIFDVVDNLESTATNAPLSANQGRVLKETINDIEATLETTIRETISNVEDKLEQLIEESAGKGNANIHVGTEPPEDTTYMWIDTSAPSNLDVSTYDGRMRLKYVEMLNHVIDKVHSLSEKISTIEKNINKISSDNSVKMNELRTQLASIRSKITSLLTRVNETQYQLMNGGNLPTLKNTAKQLRKEMKQDVLYGLADLNYNVMVVLDSEVQFIQPDPDNPNNPDNPSTDVDSSSLLTEDGFILLTEDGLVVLIDGATSSDNIKDAILTELGQAILTEDGTIILIDGGTSSDESSDILQGAVLTEQGKVLLLENGKQLLKG